MFAIFIALLGIFQSFVIPDEIAKEEQDHASQLDSEFSEIYGAAISAGGEETSRQASTVTLGTTYQARLFLLTPPPATGKLETQNQGEIDVRVNDDPEDIPDDDFDEEFLEDTCGLNSVSTRSLSYTVQYNEYRDTSTRTFETGVEYKVQPNGAVTKSNQALVRENNGIHTINFNPVTTGSVNAQGYDAETVAFESGLTGRLELVEFNSSNAVEIDIPVQNPDAWANIYSEDVGNVSVEKKNDDEVTMTLNEGKYRISCTPLGINDRPGNNPNPPQSEGEEGDTGAVNPIGDDSLVYLGTNDDGDWLFQKKGSGTATVDAVRVPWSSDPGNDGENITLSFKTSDDVDVEIGDDEWEDLEEDHDGPWVWNSGEAEPIVVDYSGLTPNTEFSFVVRFEDGSTSTYFVNGESGGGGGGN
jgi:hypothetical protein